MKMHRKLLLALVVLVAATSGASAARLPAIPLGEWCISADNDQWHERKADNKCNDRVQVTPEQIIVADESCRITQVTGPFWTHNELDRYNISLRCMRLEEGQRVWYRQ